MLFRFLENEIDGSNFMLLEERHLTEMKISLGSRLKLLNFISSMNDSKEPFSVPASTTIPPESIGDELPSAGGEHHFQMV